MPSTRGYTSRDADRIRAWARQGEYIPHPVPFTAGQDRTKSRLSLDPDRAPAIARMSAWRTVDKLGGPAIAARLNTDPVSYPPPNPGTGWTAQNVRVILVSVAMRKKVPCVARWRSSLVAS